MGFKDTFSKLRYNLEGQNNHTFTGKIVEINDAERCTVIETPLGRKKVPQNAYDRLGARRTRLSSDTGEVDIPF